MANIPVIDREKIESTRNLAEAVNILFGLNLEGRLCIFSQEAMIGETARAYDELGRTVRSDTYRRIAKDFKLRTGYYGNPNGAKIIYDVGVGSGLLAIELIKEDAIVYGIDISGDMLNLA